MRNSRASVREERTEGEKAVGIELGIGSNEFTFGTVGYKGEALTQNVELEASNWERARSDMLCHVVLTIEWIASCGRDGGYQLSIQAHRVCMGCAILMQTGSGPSLEPTTVLLRSRIRARASTYHCYTNGSLRVPWGTMGYNDPQPKGINSLGVPFLPHGSSSPYTLPSARLGIHEGVEPIGNPRLRSRCRIGWASFTLMSPPSVKSLSAAPVRAVELNCKCNEPINTMFVKTVIRSDTPTIFTVFYRVLRRLAFKQQRGNSCKVEFLSLELQAVSKVEAS
ncbi:hypothetical protein G5I_12417 [Acromyrmex echinatior]|uniref:Uncharacterized protein n=1 Tax=Acromyrmex echinatior TaxID=103372 RepID=F4X295_ACREC|nr:hypothetical protein G5I_12417 [Acromyrmex echinatior]